MPGIRVLALSQSLPFEGDSDFLYERLHCTLSLVRCNFVAVYSTFDPFNLRLKFCLYTIVHLLLKEFRFSLKSSLSTPSVCHTLHPGVGDGVHVFVGPEAES